MKLQREDNVNDRSVTWTVQVLIRHRRLTFTWTGPVHFHTPRSER